MLSESPDSAQWPHIATGLTYRRAIRELAQHLGCEPTEGAVLAHRLAADFDAYAAGLLHASATGVLLIVTATRPRGRGTAGSAWASWPAAPPAR